MVTVSQIAMIYAHRILIRTIQVIADAALLIRIQMVMEYQIVLIHAP
jgi:hypothetical protein